MCIRDRFRPIHCVVVTQEIDGIGMCFALGVISPFRIHDIIREVSGRFLIVLGFRI